MLSDKTIQMSINSSAVFLEGIATENIRPGTFCKWNGTNFYLVDDAPAVSIVAIENNTNVGWLGTYTTGMKVTARYCRRGDTIYGWLNAGQTVTAGGFVVYAAAGAVVAATLPLEYDLMVAGITLDTLTTTTSAGRIRILIT